MTRQAERGVLLGHLASAGQARAAADSALDTATRQAAVVAEQAAALAAARMLTDDVGLQHALVRVVYDLPGASPEQKLARMTAILAERASPEPSIRRR